MAKSVKGNSDWKQALEKLEDTLEVYLVDKAPALPENIKEFIVKYGPWITVALLVITLPGLLFALGLGTIATPFAFLGGMKAGVNYTMGILVSVVILAIEAYAIPGLMKRKMYSWKLMYYASLISGLQSILSFSLWGLVIGTGLSLYILFQIKAKYS